MVTPSFFHVRVGLGMPWAWQGSVSWSSCFTWCLAFCSATTGGTGKQHKHTQTVMYMDSNIETLPPDSLCTSINGKNLSTQTMAKTSALKQWQKPEHSSNGKNLSTQTMAKTSALKQWQKPQHWNNGKNLCTQTMAKISALNGKNLSTQTELVRGCYRFQFCWNGKVHSPSIHKNCTTRHT